MNELEKEILKAKDIICKIELKQKQYNDKTKDFDYINLIDADVLIDEINVLNLELINIIKNIKI